MPSSLPASQLIKHLIQGISNLSEKAVMLQELTEILAKDSLSDFCLIVSGINEFNSYQFSAYFVDNNFPVSSHDITQLIGQHWVDKIVETGQAKSIDNLQNYSDFLDLSFIKETQLASLLSIKTKFQGKINGLILLGKTQAYQWTQQDKDLLTEVADLVAIACHLLQLQSPLEDPSPPRDSTFSLSNIPKMLEQNPLLRLWWETTRKQLERQLESNKQLIYNVITIMSDQTRNPLAIMKMGITMLRKKELSPEELHSRLDILEKEWNKLNEINEKILKLKNLKSQQLTLSLKLLDLESLIKEIVNHYQNKWETDPEKSLSLWADLSEISQNHKKIQTDAEQLRKILQELLTNAKKFAVNNSTILLKVTEYDLADQSQIMISISNISPCKYSNNVNKFFEPFYREQTVIDTAIPGIGLGLTIVKELVERLNGTIEVDCESHEAPECCKITFKLTLPQSLC